MVARMIKTVLPRGLLGRSILIIVAPLVLLQLIVAVVFWENHWDRISSRLVSVFVGDVAVLLDMATGEARAANLHGAAARMGLRLRMEPGAALPAEPPPRENSFLERELRENLARALDLPFHLELGGGVENDDIRVSVQTPDGVVHLTTSRKRVDSSSTYVFTLWMVGSSMLLFGVAILFMRNQVRSVRRLAAAADRFGKGREIPDFKPEGAAEVRQAAIAFNLMRERIRRQIAQRTEMLAGVSHDLRTPITRMKLQLAMMGDADGIAELREDVAEMERMIEGYLAFARGEGSEKMHETDLVALLEDVVGRFRRDGRASIDLHCEEELRLPLRPHAFDRCLSNLLGNAVRHARHVSVRAGHRDHSVEILVDDDGPGIPFDKREDVFKAFFRLDSSRNPTTGGVGLGLTIARDVVRGNGGDIMLEDSPMGGLRVRIRLPL